MTRSPTLLALTPSVGGHYFGVGASSGGPTVPSARIAAMLWTSQAGAFLRRAESTETAIQE